MIISAGVIVFLIFAAIFLGGLTFIYIYFIVDNRHHWLSDIHDDEVYNKWTQ
jgi:hypothetical protein